jgi:hypothetical protein
MTDVIIDTQYLAEDRAIAFDENDAPREDMAATAVSDPKAEIEFFVQMRSWTKRDMADLIVEAAAAQMIRGFGDKKFSKLIEDRAISAITEKADAKLAAVSEAIIDQPLTPEFGAKAPVTMREFIGLYAKEYLTERVDSEGKPSKGGWGSNTYTRVELILQRLFDRKFKAEIEKATSSAILQVKEELRAAHAAVIAEEMARFRSALAKSAEK